MASFLLGAGLFSFVGNLIYGACERVNYDGCYAKKLSLLRSAPANQPKAIFIGGSATNFGVSAERFEYLTGIHSYNMGFSAGRSFDAYLESVRPYIKDGDYLFMAPELGYYSASFHQMDASTVLFYQHQNIDAVRITSFGDTIQFAGNYLINGWNGWYQSLAQGCKDFLIDTLHYKKPTIYDRWSVNGHGDYDLHKDMEPQGFAVSQSHYAIPRIDFLRDLNFYVTEWRSKVDFHPFIVAPPLDKDSVANIGELASIDEWIAQNTEIPLLLSYAKTILPHDCFFDTPLHLTWGASRETYTPLLIQTFAKYRF